MTVTLLYVKPAGATPVRDPADPTLAPLPAEGKAVPKTTYWLRRLTDRDVEPTTADAIAKGKAARLAKEAKAAAGETKSSKE